MTLISFDGAQPSIDESCFIAPGATVIGRVSIGPQSSVWFQCVLRGDINAITIGAQTNIQDGCLLHVTQRHPLIVHDRITVGHGAILHGCEIGSDCLIAMGAIVLDGARVGEGCLVGAGSLVPPGMEIPAGSLVMGVPGKVIRQITPSDKERIQHGFQNYLNHSQAYKKQLSQKQ